MSAIPKQTCALVSKDHETMMRFERSPDYFKLGITHAGIGAACCGDILLEPRTAHILFRTMVKSMRECGEDPSASIAPVPDMKPQRGKLTLETPGGYTIAEISALDTEPPEFVLILSAHGLACSGGKIYLDTDVRDLVFWAAEVIRAMGQDPIELLHD